MTAIEHEIISANGIDIHVATSGDGRAILLLHGWPHDWQLWRSVMPLLADAGYRVIAPDLRGIGKSSRASEGYDLATLAADAVSCLDALDIVDASIVAIDAGVPIAFMVGMRYPDRVRRLTLGEGLIGQLPGAECFLADGAPWWFGFHAVPGLAERALANNEATYIGWFLREHVVQPIPDEVQAAFVEAYSGEDALRCGFEYYRAFPVQAAEVRAAVKKGPLTPPVLALIGGVIGEAIHGQLSALGADVKRVDIPECGHLIPLEQPGFCAAAIINFERDAAVADGAERAVSKPR